MTRNAQDIAVGFHSRLEAEGEVYWIEVTKVDLRTILDDWDALKIELTELYRNMDGMVARMTAGLAAAEARSDELKKALEAIAKAEFGTCPIMHGTHDWGRGRFNDLRTIARVALGLTETLK